MNKIDAILYINLSHRTDRNENILNELKHLCIDTTKIHRIDAIYKPEFGALGCSMSHLKALNYIMKHENWNNCLILEDDFAFINKDITINNMLINNFFNDFPNYDCCNLSYNPWNLRCENTHINNIKKVNYAQTTSSYIISKQFIPKLINNFKESILSLMKNGNKQYNCLDIYWTRIQPESNWFIFLPPLGYQIDSYSDIENKYTSYKC